MGKRLISGNFARGPDPSGRGGRSFYSPKPRRLIEECLPLAMRDLKMAFGRKALLDAAIGGHPLQLRLGSTRVALYVLVESHRLPRRRFHRSDTEVFRTWLSCPICASKRRKLYLDRVSDAVPFGCRKCLGLRYMSQNSAGTRWWRDALTARGLLRERRRILERARQTGKTMARVGEIDRCIMILRNRVASRSRRKPDTQLLRRPMRRRYRDINLVLAHV